MTRRVRNSAVVAAVLLVFGVAAADALRELVPERAANDETRAGETTTDTDTATPGRFVPVDRGRGTLVFTDPSDCRVREVAVGSATEYPLERTRGNCALWVPAYGARIAYGVGSPEQGLFRFLDLNHPEEEFETEQTDGRIVWSFDGQRATWCRNGETAEGAVDFEFYAERVELDRCTVGYTRASEPAFVAGRSIVALTEEGPRRILTANDPIGHASFGVDGSIGVVSNGRFERYAEGGLTHARPVPTEAMTAPPLFAPDNCAVLFRGASALRLLDLGCLRGAETRLRAKDAVWSPDGRWIAAAVDDGILFRRVVGPSREVLWAQNAAELGWRGHVEPPD